MKDWDWRILDRSLVLITISIAFGTTAIHLSGDTQSATNVLVVTAIAYALLALLFVVLEALGMAYIGIQELREWLRSDAEVDSA